MTAVRLLAPAVALVLVAAGCGSSDSGSKGSSSKSSGYQRSSSASGSGGGGESLKLEANPQGELKFTKTSLTAKAGKVTLVMRNPGSSGLAHGIGIEGKGVDVDGKVVPAGSTSTASATLKPGTYEFYCPVPSHKQAGMTGKLTVR